MNTRSRTRTVSGTTPAARPTTRRTKGAAKRAPDEPEVAETDLESITGRRARVTKTRASQTKRPGTRAASSQIAKSPFRPDPDSESEGDEEHESIPESEVGNTQQTAEAAEVEAHLAQAEAVYGRFPSAELGADDNDAPSQGREHEAPEEEETPDPEADRELLIYCLPDLARTADELMGRLQNSDPNSVVHQRLLKVKSKAFYSVRDLFSGAENMFIDWSRFEILDEYTGSEDLSAVTTIAQADLVTALDMIGTEELDLVIKLEYIDNFFGKLFEPFGEHALNYELALDVRTQYFIATIAGQQVTGKNKRSTIPKWKETLAKFFCAAQLEAANDFPRIFSRGPFRSLCGYEDHDDFDGLIADRIKKIVSIIQTSPKDPVGKLRTAYDLEAVLGPLEDWTKHVYDMSKQQKNKKRKSQKASEAPVPVEEEEEEEGPIMLEEEEGGESQEIVRAESQRPSFFTGAKDVQVLFKALRDSSTSKPQQPQLLPVAEVGPSSAQLRRQNALREEEEDDDEEDPFEKDVRPLEKGKRTAMQQSLQVLQKRQRQDTLPPLDALPMRSAIPRPSQPARPPPEDTPSPEPQRQHHPAGRPSAIQHNLHPALAHDPYRQRVPWSHADTQALIACIANRSASWSTIAVEDSRAFEHPRNQQALRDKARNIKVELLLTDRLLPTGFDTVALGLKEKARVVSSGRNPHRRERHRDDQGRATRTHD